MALLLGYSIRLISSNKDEFTSTAGTSDPSGRRKRSPLRDLLYSILPRLHRHSLSHHRRLALAQTDLPAAAQKWWDLCVRTNSKSPTHPSSSHTTYRKAKRTY